jgi:hypothetical protein
MVVAPRTARRDPSSDPGRLTRLIASAMTSGLTRNTEGAEVDCRAVSDRHFMNDFHDDTPPGHDRGHRFGSGEPPCVVPDCVDRRIVHLDPVHEERVAMLP